MVPLRGKKLKVLRICIFVLMGVVATVSAYAKLSAPPKHAKIVNPTTPHLYPFSNGGKRKYRKEK